MEWHLKILASCTKYRSEMQMICHGSAAGKNSASHKRPLFSYDRTCAVLCVREVSFTDASKRFHWTATDSFIWIRSSLVPDQTRCCDHGGIHNIIAMKWTPRQSTGDFSLPAKVRLLQHRANRICCGDNIVTEADLSTDLQHCNPLQHQKAD